MPWLIFIFMSLYRECAGRPQSCPRSPLTRRLRLSIHRPREKDRCRCTQEVLAAVHFLHTVFLFRKNKSPPKQKLHIHSLQRMEIMDDKEHFLEISWPKSPCLGCSVLWKGWKKCSGDPTPVSHVEPEATQTHPLLCGGVSLALEEGVSREAGSRQFENKAPASQFLTFLFSPYQLHAFLYFEQIEYISQAAVSFFPADDIYHFCISESISKDCFSPVICSCFFENLVLFYSFWSLDFMGVPLNCIGLCSGTQVN